jgi:hypothetical protein
MNNDQYLVQAGKYQPGDLVLFSNNGLFDRLVKIFTRSQFSHAGIVLELREKYVIVGEAWGSGFDIRKRKYSELNKCKLRRSKEALANVKENIIRYIGRPYDKLNIFGLVLYKIFRIKLFSTNAKAMTCSEFSARFFYDAAFRKINFEKEFNKPYDYITPADLSKSNQLMDVV